MKENSKKLLLLLYPTEHQFEWFSVDAMARFFPNLSKAGYQSLLFLLEKKGYLRIDKTRHPWYTSLSPQGRSALEVLFPALLERDVVKDWQLVIFLSAPRSDKNFRYLRKLLLLNQAIDLTRGVFLLSKPLPSLVFHELQQRYTNALVLFKVTEWIVGDDYKIIGRKISATDSFSIYSSISNQIDQLIRVAISEKRFIESQKNEVNLAFTRLVEFLAEVNPLLFVYLPQVESPLFLLKKLQNLLQL